MPEDPFSPILDQLGDLLKLIESNAKKPLTGPVDPNVEKQLARLEEAVNRFQENVDEEIKKEGFKTEGIYQKLDQSPHLYSEMEKKIIRRCRDLGVNTFVLRVGLLRAAKQAKQPSDKKEMSKNTQKSIQKRRSKFKGVDGDSKWKRL